VSLFVFGRRLTVSRRHSAEGDNGDTLLPVLVAVVLPRSIQVGDDGR